MQLTFLASDAKDPLTKSIEPFKEMAAYEFLWTRSGTNSRKIAEYFVLHPGMRPSDLVDKESINCTFEKLSSIIEQELNGCPPTIFIGNSPDYPLKLRDAKEPVQLIYCRGNTDYLNTPGIAVVGTRKPSNEGILRTKKLVKMLVKDGFTIISGLAEGIDTCAHTTAIESGGRTIAVIGTPLNHSYPSQNKALQEKIAREHLLISQVPFLKYQQQSIKLNKLFFPERNKTMSALSEATIIIETGETSGTLIQARAAIEQKRTLFILNNCFENPHISWPARYESLGAVRVRDYQDIIRILRPHG